MPGIFHKDSQMKIFLGVLQLSDHKGISHILVKSCEILWNQTIVQWGYLRNFLSGKIWIMNEILWKHGYGVQNGRYLCKYPICEITSEYPMVSLKSWYSLSDVAAVDEKKSPHCANRQDVAANVVPLHSIYEGTKIHFASMAFCQGWYKHWLSMLLNHQVIALFGWRRSLLILIGCSFLIVFWIELNLNSWIEDEKFVYLWIHPPIHLRQVITSDKFY